MIGETSEADGALYCTYCRAHVSPPHRCESHVTRLASHTSVYSRIIDPGDAGPLRSGIQRVPRTRRSFRPVVD